MNDEASCIENIQRFMARAEAVFVIEEDSLRPQSDSRNEYSSQTKLKTRMPGKKNDALKL